MGSAFVSQQYLQNVNGYSTLEAGAAFLPAVIFMILVAPRSAKLVETRGARFTLLTGYVSLFLAFAWMLLLWAEGSPYWQVGVAYAFIGIGVGFAGTPASSDRVLPIPQEGPRVATTCQLSRRGHQSRSSDTGTGQRGSAGGGLDGPTRALTTTPHRLLGRLRVAVAAESTSVMRS
jgi:hypothetical protein